MIHQRTSLIAFLNTVIVMGTTVAQDTPTLPKTITNSIGMELVLIPAGEFMMGSPESEDGRENNERQHRVTLSQPFYLGKYEVTQGEWKQVMGTNPWFGERYVQYGSKIAATNVSWEDTLRFCKTLTEMDRTAGKLSSEEKYDLPTEAQREHACRAGSKTAYSFGDDSSLLSKYAWWGGIRGDGNAKEEPYAHKVGQKKPNAFGLHDMHGNVWEWCRDWYGDYPTYAVKDPLGPDKGSTRVIRGGSWDDESQGSRSARRSGNVPSDRGSSLGFRVAIKMAPQ